MKRILKYLMLCTALLVGVGTACGMGMNVPADGIALTEQVDTVSVTVHVLNQSSRPVKITAVWPTGRVAFWPVLESGQDWVFPLEIEDNTPLSMEIEFWNGYKCVTFAIPAFEGEVYTLRMTDDEVTADFCRPQDSSWPFGLLPTQQRNA